MAHLLRAGEALSRPAERERCVLLRQGGERATLLHVMAEVTEPRYIVVCRGPNCRERGGLPLRRRLVDLLRGQSSTRLIGYACFGQCDHGPNVAFYPEGAWYGGLDAPDAAEQVIQHAASGDRLQTRLALPESERTQHLRNIAELIGTLERDQRRPRRWWWPF
jgi:(2Fe-2S) ferredoxin